MIVLSHAPAAKVRTRPEAMATDFRFIFSCPGFSDRPSKPVQSDWPYLMQIDTQVLMLREYKQTYRAAQIAPPGASCRFEIPTADRALPRSDIQVRRGERYRAAVRPA